MCAQWREADCDACCHNLCSPISSARRGGSKVTTWTGRTFLSTATLLLSVISPSLSLFIRDPPPLVNSLQAEQCRAGPGHAGPGAGRSLTSLTLCPLFTPKLVRPLTQSLYQLIRSLCCPSAGLVSPVSLYLCFACRSRPPLLLFLLPSPASSPPSNGFPFRHCFPPSSEIKAVKIKYGSSSARCFQTDMRVLRSPCVIPMKFFHKGPI